MIQPGNESIRPSSPLALVLTGGGALAAYQVGFLRGMCEKFPDSTPAIMTGVSAGAINAVGLATLDGDFANRVRTLADAWSRLTVEKVFRVDAWDLARRGLSWGLRLVSGGSPSPKPRSLLDPRPLENFLCDLFQARDGRLDGIERNLAKGDFRAVAVTASKVRTGQSVTWVQGEPLQGWSRAHRCGIHGRLTLNHVLASAAIPWLFPCVPVDGGWYCDGGVRMTAPLSPAIHMGAEKILAISTRPEQALQAGEYPTKPPYPEPAELAGMMMSSIFLDQLDGDGLRTERINKLIASVPSARDHGLRPLKLLLVRPSQNPDTLANRYEPDLPWTLRFLTRGLGTRESRRNEFLSLLMFQPDYLEELLTLGHADARKREDELREFLEA